MGEPDHTPHGQRESGLIDGPSLDECAECGTHDDLIVGSRFALCRTHVDLWFPKDAPEDDIDCRSIV